MQRCWQLDQSERPEFKDIVEELDSLLLAESDYLALENYHAENFAELEPSEEEKVWDVQEYRRWIGFRGDGFLRWSELMKSNEPLVW